MIAAAGDWGRGYVTDIPYLPGYYRHQSPLHLNLACLLGGAAGIEIGPTSRLSYLELGCGQGFGALMLAACNPTWQVIGIDYNPAHIAAARALCAEAECRNAWFSRPIWPTAEAPVGRELPQADVVTMHGLWSWVGDAARAGIVRLAVAKSSGRAALRTSATTRCRPGRARSECNAILLESGARTGGHSDRQVAAGWELVRAMIDADAHHLRDGALVQSLSEVRPGSAARLSCARIHECGLAAMLSRRCRPGAGRR